ncbi:MAG: glutamine--fructose-6-phosphate transaminase (isomerizing) [Bdellovibrionota bacterium]
MCGIIAYVGEKDCADFLIAGLKRLEYRGYDSAGIACANGHGFEILKAEGKLENIASLHQGKPLKGSIGVGHTRWATHGKPNAVNAHPHRTGSTVLVHNGIIENYESLREELVSKGYRMVSETDSELFGHLVEEYRRQGIGFEESVRLAFLRLEGSCSVVVVNDEFPDRVVAIRNGTPLVVARAQNAKGTFVASDAQAILEHTNTVTFLENEDMVVCERDKFAIFSLREPQNSRQPISRSPVVLDWTLSSMDKAGFPHYMLKEIHEQPRAVLDTLDNLVERDTGAARFEILAAMMKKASKIQLLACGTAWHAALIGKYILEREVRIPVEVDLASEYRYRDPVVGPDTLVIAISQSGETADTLAALREAKRAGAMTAAICNVRGSTLSREASTTLFTAAGPEIGVASTKAFTTQILVLMLIGQYIGRNETFDIHFFSKLPHLLQGALDQAAEVQHVAQECIQSKGFLFIARGRLFPIALEGALKLKEISYIHAEGYPAGELKHGPIAMVEPSMTVVVLAPRDELYEKTISNLQEVKARGGRIVAIGTKGDLQLKKMSDYFLGYDFAGDWSDTLLASIPAQLLAYHAAVLKGTDVDKPRNLAKSVTVE